MLQEPQCGLRVGELVRVRGGDWRLTGVSGFAHCEALRLSGIDSRNRGVERTLIYPFDRPQPLGRTRRLRMTRRTRWLRAFSALTASVVTHARLRTAAGAGISLFAYQLEPALAILSGRASRVLLADEVGLGKTIQAGLVVAELLARGQAARSLVLAPAGLCDQWAGELSSRFAIPGVVVDAASLRREAATLPRGTNPWSIPRVSIVSIDFVKQPEILRSLESIVWDVLLVDEAHLAAAATDRGAAARLLASRARRLLLLTATPHAGDQRAFENLCELGRTRAATCGPIVMFRRSHREVGWLRERRPHLLAVAPTAEERRMHALLDRYINEVWREASAGEDRQALVAMMVLKKRALSSAGSLARSVRRRLETISGVAAASVRQLSLPLEAPDDGEATVDDEEPSAVLAAPGLSSFVRERAWLGALYEAARTASQRESKLGVLYRLLRRTTEPVIIFTEYRDTLAGIGSRLSGRWSTVLLHGGLSRADRRLAEDRFNGGAARVLLATDAAGAGLNLHARCRWVVNYELPWNPMRLDQRIGRVDRIGQTRPVHAIHLLARHTAEADILGRLIARLERVRTSLGHVEAILSIASEPAIAEAMLGGDSRLGPELWIRHKRRPDATSDDAGGPPMMAVTEQIDLRTEAAAELERLTLARRLHLCCRSLGLPGARAVARSDRMPAVSLLAHLDRTAPWATLIPAKQILGRRARRKASTADDSPQWRLLTGALVCLFRARITDANGELVEVRLIPVQAWGDPIRSIGSRAAARLEVERLLAAYSVAMQNRVQEELRARVAAIERHRAPGLRRAHDRESSIAEHLLASFISAPVELGLFDHRALRQAELDRLSADRHRAESAHRLARLEAAADLSIVGEPELVLAMLIA